MAVVSNALGGPPDEGTRKLAQEILRALGDTAMGVSIDGSSPLAARKLLLGRPITQLRGKTKTVVYVPTQSLTFGTYIRVQTLKRMAGCRVVLIAPQARTPLPLERRWGRLAGPDVLLSPSLEVVERAAAAGIDARFLAPGVDDARFRPVSSAEKAALREKHGLRDGKLVLHVGHASPHRNLAWLIEARRRSGVVVVVVVGRSQGVDETTIRTLEEAGITVLSEFVPNIADIYAAADCYAFPVQNERGAIGTPLSVLEAMACNLPVVTTPFGGLPAMFRPGRGLFFEDRMTPWIDALERCLDLRPEDVSTRSVVSEYSWDRVASRVVEVAIEIAAARA